MELEEMKLQWAQMSVELAKQKKITDSLILKMIKSNYRNQISKLIIPEAIGSFICLAEGLYLVLNLQKLPTWYLLACGIISSIILFFLPLLSMKAVRNMQRVTISLNNYKQSLLEYSKGKMQFVYAQKVSFYLGAVLLVTGLPAMGMIVAGKDLFTATSLWLFYAIGFPFFYFFAKSVFKSYIKKTADAECILKELES